MQKKILIVDDYELNLNLIEEILSEQNYNLFFARNGAQAIKTIEQNHDINIILMDIKMPEIDGFKATKIIREKNKEVVIICLKN